MKKTCVNGHVFEKSSDCPTCPVCEKKKSYSPEFPKLSKPAHRALERAGILKLKDLAKWTEKDLLALHGVGPSAIPPLKIAMKKAAVKFKATGLK
jgi:hypothetical protein